MTRTVHAPSSVATIGARLSATRAPLRWYRRKQRQLGRASHPTAAAFDPKTRSDAPPVPGTTTRRRTLHLLETVPQSRSTLFTPDEPVAAKSCQRRWDDRTLGVGRSEADPDTSRTRLRFAFRCRPTHQPSRGSAQGRILQAAAPSRPVPRRDRWCLERAERRHVPIDRTKTRAPGQQCDTAAFAGSGCTPRAQSWQDSTGRPIQYHSAAVHETPNQRYLGLPPADQPRAAAQSSGFGPPPPACRALRVRPTLAARRAPRSE